MTNKLEIFYADEDEVLVNPHRHIGYAMRFHGYQRDVHQAARRRLRQKIDSESTIVSISVTVNQGYLMPAGYYDGCKKVDIEFDKVVQIMDSKAEVRRVSSNLQFTSRLTGRHRAA